MVESFLAFINTLFFSAEDLRNGTFLAGGFFAAFFTVASTFLALFAYSIIELAERACSDASVV